MRSHPFHHPLTVVLLALLLIVPGLSSVQGQIPDGFEVVQLANDLGIHSRPEINNDSEVVWSSSFPPDVSDVWLYSEGVIRKITDANGYDVFPALNNLSEVAWMRCESFGDLDCQLGSYEEGLLNLVHLPVSVDQTPAINDTGVVAFGHDFSGDFIDVAVFLLTGESLEQISDNGVSNQVPRINERSEVVWVAIDFGVSPFTTSFMMYRDGAVTELASEDTHPGIGDINDLSQVVWGSNNGIVLWEEGKTTVITDGGGSPKINNLGNITFAIQNEETQRNEAWLFKDDTFFLLSAPEHSISGPGINDRDEVVWRSLVNDFGDTGIFMLRRIMPSGDFDGDCHIDFRDWRAMQVCFTGANGGPPGGFLGDCAGGDFDGDNDIDLDDFALFQGVFTGAANVVSGCDP